MAEMHRIDSPGIARTLPVRGKRPDIIDMSIAWSRTGVCTGPLPTAAHPRVNPAVVGAARSMKNRSLGNHVQEHAIVMKARTRVLHKIASHRQKSRQLPPAAALLAPSPTGPLQFPIGANPVSGKRVLTPRELEVLRLVARGESDRGIAERLYLSRRTVSCHVSNILEKLDVESRRKAVLIAMRIGLL